MPLFSTCLRFLRLRPNSPASRVPTVRPFERPEANAATPGQIQRTWAARQGGQINKRGKPETCHCNVNVRFADKSGVCFGEGNCYTRASHHRTGRSLWQPTKPRNAHIRFVRVRSLRRSIAARSARRWKKSRTWIASALTRSARVERNTQPTHSHRRRPTRRIRTRLLGPVQQSKSGSRYQHVRFAGRSSCGAVEAALKPYSTRGALLYCRVGPSARSE
jgi:hypothetical protein